MSESKPANKRHFFVTGGTLPRSASSYVERSADAELLEGILQGAYVYVLDSRQIGKSSLSIRALEKLKSHGHKTAFVDLTKFGVRNVTPEQWYLAMLREVGRELNLLQPFAEHWQEQRDLSPVQRFFGALQEVALKRISDSIAIFVDEIDVTRSVPFDTDEFFAGIRQCYVGRATNPDLERLTFSFFGSASPPELIKDAKVSPFNVGSRVELHDFTVEEALVLAAGLPGDGTALLKRIHYWTNGHPYLTQKLCHLIAGEDGRISVDRACEALFFERAAKESDDNLAFVNNRLLNSNCDIASVLEVYAKVVAGKHVRDDQADPICSLLRLSGISRTEAGGLKVRNRIYAKVFNETWIRQLLPDAELRRQRQAYTLGLLRASAIAASVVAVVTGLAAFGFSQARRASEALEASRHLTQSLKESQAKLTAALAQAKQALQLANDRRRSTELAQVAAKGEAEKARASSALAATRLSDSLVAGAMGHLDVGDGVSALKPLLDALRLDGNVPHRAAMHRMRLDYAVRSASNLLQVWKGTGPMIDAEYFPDSKKIMTADASGNIRIGPADSRQAAPSIKVKGLKMASLSLDGRFLVTGAQDGVARLFDAHSGRAVRSWWVPGNISRVLLADDHEKVAIAFTGSDQILKVRAFAVSGHTKPEIVIDAPGAHLRDMAFAPGDKRFAAVFGNYLAYTIDLGDGNGDWPIGYCHSASHVRFVHDGRMILIDGTTDIKLPVQSVAQLCTLSGKPIIQYLAPETHDGVGAAFRLTRDEETVLVATDAGVLQEYDLRTGAMRGPTMRATGTLTDCDLSPDGRRIAAASLDGSVQVWNASSGERVGSVLWHAGPVESLHFDSTGYRLLTSSEDGAARLWELQSPGVKSSIAIPNIEGPAPWVGWSLGDRLVFSGNDHCYTWQPDVGRRSLPGGYSLIRSLATGLYQQSMTSLPATGFRGTLVKGSNLFVYDFRAGKPLTPNIPTIGGVSRENSNFGLSIGGHYLFEQPSSNILRIRNVDRGGQTISTVRLLRPAFIDPRGYSSDEIKHKVGVELLPTRDRVLTRSKPYRDSKGNVLVDIDIWAMQSGRHLHTLSLPDFSDWRTDDGGAAFLVDQGRAGAYRLRAFRTTDGAQLPFQLATAGGDIDWISRPDLRRLVVRPENPVLVDTASWKAVRTYHGRPDSWNFLVQNGAKSFFLVGEGRLADLESGAEITPPLVHGPIRSAAFSPDGAYLAASTPMGVFVNSVKKATTIGPIMPGGYSEVGFSPQSDLLYTLSNQLLRFWDPQTGEEVIPAITCSNGPVGFSPDGKWMSFEVHGNVEVAQLPSGSANPYLVQQANRLCATQTRRTLPADWKALLRHGTSDTGPVPGASPIGSTYTLEDALRDSRMSGDDLAGELQAAQAAARAGLWKAASDSLQRAIAKGAQGPGIYFLKGLIELNDKDYSAAERDFMHEDSSDDRGEVQSALFQSAVGSRHLAAADKVIRKNTYGKTDLASTRSRLYGMLVEVAAGQRQRASDELREFVRKGQDGELNPGYPHARQVIASVAACLAGDPRLLANDADAFESTEYEDDHTLGPTTVLCLARVGRRTEAQRLLATTDPTAPECLMARALILKATPGYAKALRDCAIGCSLIVRINDCRSLESTLKVLRAIVLEREADSLLAR